ncbi:LptF/LptG family permease [Maribacter halichondriae]|uniref:LptF/LptG family permease n=1 Tax=Maribacter halichondriae TaxID=2980554 RepID=UPI003D311165
MFIFIFQAIWLFMDDLAGKGLDMLVIGKFFFYKMPELTEKVLPLTVILSSILTFGTFAENYEFAAMKASGISLRRAMFSIIVFVLILGGVTFYFANSIIPVSEQKIYNMRRNIAQVKPAAAIEEGVFSDFEGMSIKVDEKYGDKDRFLRKVTIHQKTNLKVNNTVIKAKTGELISSEDSDIIQLVLRDGHYYEDIETQKNKDKLKEPFAKAKFEIYRMNIEIPEMDMDLEEDRNISTDKMKNVSRLNKDIDSLKNDNLRVVGAFSKNINNRIGAFVPVAPVDSFITKKQREMMRVDSLREIGITKYDKDGVKKDSLPLKSFDDILELFQDWQRIQILNSAKNNATNVLTSVKAKKDEIDRRYKIYNLHIYSLHAKFALALSCVVLFFVGAPLGAIIRKGGLGLPMVIAIILFLVYYFVGVFAKNYAVENNIHPIFGAWLPTLIMLPLGIVLTKRATADKGLMSIGNAFDRIKEFFKKRAKPLRHDFKYGEAHTIEYYRRSHCRYSTRKGNHCCR